MHRRFLLLLAATAVAMPCAARALPDAAASAVPRRLALRHAGTGARFAGLWHDGLLLDPVAMADLSAALADSRAVAPRPFDPRAVEVLWDVARRSGLLGEELTILSGYRTPAINRAVHGAGDSQHLRASAVDVLVPGRRLGEFARVALALGAGGVGTYTRRGFVHLDSGPVRQWTESTTLVAEVGGGKGAAGGGLNLTLPQDRIARMAEAWAAARPPRP